MGRDLSSEQEARLREEFAEHGDMNSTAKLVLKELNEADGPLTRREIECRVHIHERTATRALSRLHKKELVYRDRAPDDLRKCLYSPRSQ